MGEKEFAEGLFFKPPSDKAPEYVIGSLSIKRNDLINWLTPRGGEWVNLNIKRSQGGKVYFEVDTWKPSGEKPAQTKKPAPQNPIQNDPFPDDGIPF